MSKISLKAKIRAGEFCLGSWLTLGHGGIAETMAKSGFDWIAVDLEHSVLTIREAEEMIRIIELSGCAPLVRLTSINPDLIKRVMDAGAHGVIAPMVKSKKDVEILVESLHYPPRGKRGVGLARAQGYGSSFEEYKTWLEKESVLVVQIEHIDAVKNAEEILSHEAVDAFIIGPYDLSASMGYAGQLTHPKVLEAIGEVRKVADKLKKSGGPHLVEPIPANLKKSFDEGFRFVAYGVDFRMIDQACRAGMHAVSEVRLKGAQK